MESSFDALTTFDEEFATMGEKTGIEKEEEIEYPFDAEKINISVIPTPLSRLLERIENNTISAPDIQRADDLWDIEKKSRLIESLMLKIPLPLFYVAADPDENWKVVDGLQRVNVIKQFMIEKEFKLRKLEFLTDYNGGSFEDLHGKYKNRIKDTVFQFAVISATTPQEVQRNIFKRLNTGGLPLTHQEVRHALYFCDKTSSFLKDLATAKEFLEATGGTVKDTRMAARELVLRFISFLIRDCKTYPKNHNMDEFLSDTMVLMNEMPELKPNVLEKAFYKRKVNTTCKYRKFEDIKTYFCIGMLRARDLFDGHAFRKSTSLSSYKAPVNKSIFECVAICLSQMSQERFEYLMLHKHKLIEFFHSELKNNIQLNHSISRNSQEYKSVEYRFDWFRKVLLEQDYGGEDDCQFVVKKLQVF